MLVLIITIVGGFLRFYNLLWGHGLFFHPDERNMIVSVIQMSPQNGFHPHFFAYGQLPLYLAYFSHQVSQSLYSFTLGLNHSVSFQAGAFWLRFYSALASTLTIPMVYLIAKRLLLRTHFKTKRTCHAEFASLNAKSEHGEFVSASSEILNQVQDDSFEIGSNHYPLIAATLVAFTPGLIQAAHFGTTECLLTFFLVTIVYLSLKILSFKRMSTVDGRRSAASLIILLGVATGLALGTKLSAAFFVVAPLMAITLISKKTPGSIVKRIASFLLFTIYYLLLTTVFFFLSSPYNFLESNEFLRINVYEAEVAQGEVPVFYTQQFENTTPIVYQLTRIFPYALGWPLLILGLVGFLLIFFLLTSKFIWLSKLKLSQAFNFNRRSSVKVKYSNQLETANFPALDQLIIIISFVSYFLPNAFLFCKWTRFMTPIMPMFSVFTSYLLFQLYTVLKSFSKGTQSAISERSEETSDVSRVKLKARFPNVVRKLATSVASNYSLELKTFNFLVVIFSFSLLALTLIPGLLFFSIYLKPDVRVEASEWIYKNIPENAYILSETGNVVDIPVRTTNYQLPTTNYKVISFDFYHLDEDPKLFDELTDHLVKADYLFIPSRRIFPDRLRLLQKYPLTARYYQLLFSGNLGFQKIAQFARFPDQEAEQTWRVFDHPEIRIYQKIKPFSQEEYHKMLKSTKVLHF